MHLDRQLQNKILNEFRDSYPNRASVQMLSCFEHSRQFFGNLIYLKGHGLIEGEVEKITEDRNPFKIMSFAEITPAGLDFLEDDGGLGAILGRVVVKFDENDVIKLIEAVDLSNAPADIKDEFKKVIKSLPAEGLKTICTWILTQGLGNLRALFPLMKSMGIL